MIQEELYLHTQWEDCSPDANSLDGKMTVSKLMKQGNGTMKLGTMSYNNSLEKNNPSFKAPDVWSSYKIECLCLTNIGLQAHHRHHNAFNCLNSMLGPEIRTFPVYLGITGNDLLNPCHSHLVCP